MGVQLGRNARTGPDRLHAGRLHRTRRRDQFKCLKFVTKKYICSHVSLPAEYGRRPAPAPARRPPRAHLHCGRCHCGHVGRRLISATSRLIEAVRSGSLTGHAYAFGNLAPPPCCDLVPLTITCTDSSAVDKMVTVTHGHSRPHRTHQFVAGLLAENRMSNERRSGLTAGGGEGSELPEFSFT
ncbi:hypothetical protein EVAR_22390_1 [Eumeta japonica]|uniref:Uncharacterized protein n=1 Tax=Eumeta variegata TaxID=151549 RepID=A0A4C1VJP1_EUMVA|nr:hypothetical protein EVAR_22390_1 [Eumeta japonica]